MVESVAASLALTSGRAVSIEGTISATHQIATGPNRYRCILDTEVTHIAQPVPIVPTLLQATIEPRIRRVISWWARGIAQPEAGDRLLAFMTALELLVGFVDGGTKNSTKDRGVPFAAICRLFAVHKRAEASTRVRVVLFLTSKGGLDESLSNKIWRSRNDLAHGHSHLTEEDGHRYYEHGNYVAIAIRNYLGQRLGIALPPLPRMRHEFRRALMDIEATD